MKSKESLDAERDEWLGLVADDAVWEIRKWMIGTSLWMGFVAFTFVSIWQSDRTTWQKDLITVVAAMAATGWLMFCIRAIAGTMVYAAAHDLQWHRVYEQHTSVVDEIIELSPEPDEPIDYHGLMDQKDADDE